MNGFLWDKIVEEYEGDHADAFKLGASKETMARIINEDVPCPYSEIEEKI